MLWNMSCLMCLSSAKCDDKFDLMSSIYFILLFALAWFARLLLLWGLSLTVLPSCFISISSHFSSLFIFHIQPPCLSLWCCNPPLLLYSCNILYVCVQFSQSSFLLSLYSFMVSKGCLWCGQARTAISYYFPCHVLVFLPGYLFCSIICS